MAFTNIYSTYAQEALKQLFDDDGNLAVTGSTGAFTALALTTGAGANYTLISDADGNLSYVKNNYVATTNPGTSDDGTQGYRVGSKWINTSTTEIYVCISAATGNAVWEQSTLTLDDLGSMATQNANAVAITGGTIDGTTIGGTTPAAGAFTTLKQTTGAADGAMPISDATGAFTLTASTGAGAPVRAAGAKTTFDEIIKTASGTLTAAEVSGTAINNYNQSDNVALELPAAAEGYSALITLGTTVAKYFRLTPASGEIIALDGATTGADKYIEIASAVKYASIYIYTIQTGASTFEWCANTIVGLWTQEA